jgi:hypothetical protein
MTFPYCNQADIVRAEPRIIRERRRFDDEGYERTKRRNGACECPKCGLWWPCIEEPDCWELDEESGKWNAVSWWGGVVCEECELLMIEQPDGTGECYDIG